LLEIGRFRSAAAFFETVRWRRRSGVQLSSFTIAISTHRPGADNIVSSGRPAFDALHQMRGKVELAKFQLCAKMDPFEEAQYP